MTEEHASAVFDCMVFLQGAARRGGPAGLCLSLAEAGAIRLFLSDEILAEVLDVLTRPELRRKFPILTEKYVDEFLALESGQCLARGQTFRASSATRVIRRMNHTSTLPWLLESITW